MDDHEKQKLEEFIERLKNYKGSHTELVSVLIPAGYSHVAVSKQLEAEKSTAKNIKSTTTRNNVIDALERIIRFLKSINKTPKNGLAVYCGNISNVEGQNDIQIFSVEPPIPLNIRLYRCDKEFVLDPLEEMLEVNEVYGLVVMDRKEATIGLLEGKRIKVIEHMTSGVPSKVRAGGQSAARFSRITEGLAKEFFRRIAERMKEIFFDMLKLKGIIIGGPIPTKEEFMDESQLVTKLKEKVIGLRDIGDADESGLKELVAKSRDLLSQQEIIREKKLLERFFESLSKKPDLVVYGYNDVKKALQYGAVQVLFLSKKVKKEWQEELKKMALSISASVEIISTDTTEGEQFYNLSGIGALLRFGI